MQLERKLLSCAVSSRESFDKADELDAKEYLSDKARLVWDEIDEYYDTDPGVGTVDIEVLAHRLGRKYPKHAEVFAQVVGDLGEVSVPNVLEEVVALRKAVLRDQLSAAFASGTEETIDKLLSRYSALKQEELEALNAQSEVFKGASATQLVERSGSGSRIKLLPVALNELIRGGVLRQHHIVIFAPTDMGKTLFVLNMVYGFLKQGLTVLYCGNEDPAADVLMRLLGRITGMRAESIEKHPDKADNIAKGKNWDKLVFAEMAPGTPREIEALIQEHKPDVLVVDQIRNLDMGEKNFVRTLEMAAQMMRRLGKQYNIVPISITQAADSATGKNYLTRGDIDNSNVGIPGTADLMIGIGADGDTEAAGFRWLSLVKNKVGGIKTPIKVKFDPVRTSVE